MQTLARSEPFASRPGRVRPEVSGKAFTVVLVAVAVTLGVAPSAGAALSFSRTDYKLPSLKATSTESARAAEIGPSSGYSGSSVALVDLNGDGRLDIVVADYGTGRVDVLLNKGGGKFAPAPGSPFPACGGDLEASNIVAGQLNPQTDQNPDVAVICDGGGGSPYGIVRLLGNGKGSLGAPQAFFTPGVGAPLKLGHLSGTPGGDYLFGNSQGYACFIPVESPVGTGTATCDFPTQTTPGAYGGGMTPVHWYNGPCFKGDQVLSYSGSATSSSPATFVGWGLQPRSVQSGLTSCGAPFQASNNRSTGIVLPNAFMAITTGDLNGAGPDLDGDNHAPDVVFGDSGGGFHVVPWQGASGSFGGGIPPTEHPSNFMSAAPIFALRIADLNGDGCPDVAALEHVEKTVGNNYVEDNFVAIHSGHCATTQFGAAQKFHVAGGPGGYTQYPQIAIGDLNGDGMPDIVTAAGGAPNAAVTVLLNTNVAVSKVVPNAGPIAGGNKVTIEGANFAPGAIVKFGSTASASVTFVSATRLQAVAPKHSSGAVNVTVKTAHGTSATSSKDVYTY
jgi:IPT/TIG domain/FG-GAP-like repeat/FG-GAP repeat